MTSLTRPLREEHRELFPHVEQLRQAADAIGETPTDAIEPGVDAAVRFLTSHLIPHAAAEEAVLYPAVARIMGAPEATATMRHDHVEIGRLTAELGELRERLHGGARDAALSRDLRRVLYGLYTLVGVHFAKEEEVYLPILDARMTPDDAHALFHDMAAAAHTAHAAAHSAHGAHPK